MNKNNKTNIEKAHKVFGWLTFADMDFSPGSFAKRVAGMYAVFLFIAAAIYMNPLPFRSDGMPLGSDGNVNITVLDYHRNAFSTLYLSQPGREKWARQIVDACKAGMVRDDQCNAAVRAVSYFENGAEK